MPAAIANREAIVTAVLDRIADGEYLADICRDKGMPNPKTIRQWINGDEELTRQRAQARADAAELEEWHVAQIAAKVEAGEIEPEVARVAIHARTWLAKVRNPKVYGDRLDVEHSGKVQVVPVLNVTLGPPGPTGPLTIDVTPDE